MNGITVTDVRVNKGDGAFLVDNGKTAILYDTGFAFTGNAVAEKIKTVLGERPLDFIFLTHSHYDHALGSAYISKHWKNVKIVAGSYAEKIFAKPSARAVMRDLDKKAAAAEGIYDYEDYIDDLRVDIAVSDGDVVKAGDMEFTVLELPGHTKCSVGYYNEKAKLLLGCETLGVFNGEDDVVPSYLVGFKMTIDSINKVEKLQIENILIPHYGILSKEKSALFLKRAKESACETADEIVKMLKKDISKEEIADYFKNKFYNGYVKEIYPACAMKLNTNITINLLEKELL